MNRLNRCVALLAFAIPVAAAGGCAKPTVELQSNADPATVVDKVTTTIPGTPRPSALTRVLSVDRKSNVDMSKYPMHAPRSWQEHLTEIKGRTQTKATLSEASQAVGAAFNVPLEMMPNVRWAGTETFPQLAGVSVLFRPPSFSGDVLVEIANNAALSGTANRLEAMRGHAKALSEGPGLTNVTKTEVATVLDGTVPVQVTYTAGRVSFEFQLGTQAIAVDIAPDSKDQVAAEDYVAELAARFVAVNPGSAPITP